MISKIRKYPLRNNARILRQGKRSRGKLVEIFTLPSESPRFAVIVGKSVSLKASLRNLVRRQIFGVLEKQPESLGKDVVVRALSSSRETTYEKLETEINELVSKN